MAMNRANQELRENCASVEIPAGLKMVGNRLEGW
jgi:hypothetical protein